MKSLLIVDDDKTFCEVLGMSLSRNGYEVKSAHTVYEAIKIANEFNPEFVLADLKMPGASGLELIPEVLKIDPNTKIVVLTGYANMTTAIEAIKLGAVHYLSKPVAVEDIIAAFDKKAGDPKASIDAPSQTLDSAEWEHIIKSLKRNQNNISATAKELGMHRRSLQRKLEKMPNKYREGL